MKRSTIILALMVVSSFAYAVTHGQLTGTYRIGGKTFYDPPEEEPQNTHIYIQLTGSTAKDMYNVMDAKPQYDICVDNGSKTKTIGEMQCTRSADGKDYRCWFGVDLKRQKITRGVVC